MGRDVCRPMLRTLALTGLCCVMGEPALAQEIPVDRTQIEQLGPPVAPSAVPEVSAPAAGAEQGKNEDKSPGAPTTEKPEERVASPNQPAMPAPSAATSGSICLLLESAADAHGLPLEFFARLIWQESQFKPNAIGPMTRRGTRAQGIAQFMPGTASERGLLDPFDPVAALPKAAEYLEALHTQFGNLGLAAAAYNAGPRRVRDFLAGRNGLPSETRNYVLKITGIGVDEWAALGGAGDKGPVKRTNCNELMAMLTEQPSPFIGELARRVKEGGERPWGVELTAGFSRGKVLAAYATLEKTYRLILENHDPVIIENQFRSRGTQPFYQVRLGADTRSAADQICGSLRKAGGACLVLRNLRGKSQAL